MTTVLCTLYNSLYLDKGLVLYDSLCDCARDFKLYVLCMDEKCYEVLTDLKQERHIPVRLCDFEEGDESLRVAKTNRPMGEYCWTCSSSFIRYVLTHYKEGSCTYIDADMCFYSDPQALVDEMLAAGKSVMVVPHRFSKDREVDAKVVGKYCVEFNTFLNTSDSMEALEYWRKRCLECCSNQEDGIHWGDQKYLEELVEKFECVHVCVNPGAGVAPWNICEYKKALGVDLIYRSTHKTPLVFYHYQGISNINTDWFVIGGVSKRVKVDKVLYYTLYSSYLKKIQIKREHLHNKYKVSILFNGHPALRHRFTVIKNTRFGGILYLVYLSLIQRTRIMKVPLRRARILTNDHNS